MTKRPPIFVWIYWGIVSSIIFLFFGFELLTFFRNIPYVPRDSVVVFVKPGSSVKEISTQLSESNILLSPWKFRFLTRLRKKQAALKPGEYRFDLPSTPWAVLETLIGGKVLRHKITVREGLTVKDVTEIVTQTKLVNINEFQNALARQDLLKSFEVPSETFEGFLFPDTYYFTKTDGAIRILETMVARFRQAIVPQDEHKAKEIGFNLLQWVTLASIIEKESNLSQEHRFISSVFHNRLRKRMRLQSDPTVIYGIPNFNGNLTKKDLTTKTPYNTYTKYGLPPGPIGNPGASALHAAVNPENTDYLYFVADRKGRHVFSKTYKEHLKAVLLFQLPGSANARNLAKRADL